VRIWRRTRSSTPPSRKRVFNNREAGTEDELYWKLALAETEAEREQAEWAMVAWFRRHPRDDPGEFKWLLREAGITWVYDRAVQAREQTAARAGITLQQYDALSEAEQEAIIERQVKEDMERAEHDE
jgi:hypothetical protein